MVTEALATTGSHETPGESFGVEVGNIGGLYAELIKKSPSEHILDVTFNEEGLDPTYDLYDDMVVSISQERKVDIDPAWADRYGKERNAPERNATVYTLRALWRPINIEGSGRWQKTLFQDTYYNWPDWHELQTEFEKLGLKTHILKRKELVQDDNPRVEYYNQLLIFEKFRHLFTLVRDTARVWYHSHDNITINITMDWWEGTEGWQLEPNYTIPDSQRLPSDLTDEADLVSSLHDLAEVMDKTVRVAYAIEGKQLPPVKYVIEWKRHGTREAGEPAILPNVICGYCKSFYHEGQIEVEGDQMIIHDAECSHCGAQKPELLKPKAESQPSRPTPRRRKHPK